MNIGYDASRAYLDKKTGTENYSYQILSHLQKLDHNNKYYIYVRAGFSRPLQLGSENPTPTIIPYPKLWTQFGLALQTFIDPLDVLFVPSHTLPIIRRPGLKTVITVHDLGAEYLPQAHQLKQRLYLNFMTYHQLKSATHIIAVSKATKQDIIKKVGIDPKKITVIYEGYNQDLFKPCRGGVIPVHKRVGKPDPYNQYNIEPGNYFLFVGTIQPRKNLERLILAYAKFLDIFEVGSEKLDLEVRNFDNQEIKKSRNQGQENPTSNIKNSPPILVLAGGKGWLSDEIYALPKKLGIADKVKFLGYVPDEDLPALYSGAKAFLFPSLFEGFGLPILEAWACNCPVLTSNISSMKEIVTIKNDDRRWKIENSNLKMEGRKIEKQIYPPSSHPAAILVDPYSVEDIAQGIKRVQSPESRVKLIKKGQEQLKKFSWEKSAKETLKVFSEMNHVKK